MVRNCKIIGEISIFFSVGISLQNFTMKEKNWQSVSACRIDSGNIAISATMITTNRLSFDKNLFGNEHGKDYSNAIKLLTTTTCTLGGLHVTKDTVLHNTFCSKKSLHS